MWYPLKNSIFSLSVASLALIVLLAVARPAAEEPQVLSSTSYTSSIETTQMLDSVAVLANHLLVVDEAQKASIAATLRQAAEALAEQTRHDAVLTLRREGGARSERRRAAMPFFSFGSLLDATREPGA